MTQFAELALIAVIVTAVGAGTIALLSKPHTPTVNLPPPTVEVAVLRAKPLTDGERIDLLQQRLAEVSAEQKRLIEDLKIAVGERRNR